MHLTCTSKCWLHCCKWWCWRRRLQDMLLLGCSRCLLLVLLRRWLLKSLSRRAHCISLRPSFVLRLKKRNNIEAWGKGKRRCHLHESRRSGAGAAGGGRRTRCC